MQLCEYLEMLETLIVTPWRESDRANSTDAQLQPREQHERERAHRACVQGRSLSKHELIDSLRQRAIKTPANSHFISALGTRVFNPSVK